MEKKKYSPMVQHYLSMKEKNPDTLLFYRLGDFYEMFFEDAKTASRELDLVLTSKAAGNNEKIPMCGIPYHAANSYLQRLIKKGYKVSICEQLSDPAASKGLVERDIIKIVTPGTYMDSGLDAKDFNYMASIIVSGWKITVLLCELSTGYLAVKQIEKNIVALIKLLLEFDVKEVVVAKSFPADWQTQISDNGILLSTASKKELTDQESELLSDDQESVKAALQLLLSYLKQTQKQSIDHFMPIEQINQSRYLKIDFETKNHLELTHSSSASVKAKTLFSYMDRTNSVLGARLLKTWIENPLNDLAEIKKRQQTIDQINDDFFLMENLKEHLSGIYDLERLSSRIAYGNASPRDVLQLITSLAHGRQLVELFGQLSAYPELAQVSDCSQLYEEIKDSIVDNPPLTMKDGGIFKTGYSQQLDQLRRIAEEGNQYILEQEAFERERTGIKALKIGYNRVYGYYIEVRNGSLNAIKDEFGYIPRQTLTNATRFITEDLKKREQEILSAQDNKVKLELDLFAQLLKKIKSYLYELHALAKAIAAADVLVSLAQLASEKNFVKPVFNDQHQVQVIEGYHPVIKDKLSSFVSNDWIMNDQVTAQIITGPNMGGKSTFMRQNAIIVIMAQMGSFVPAKSCWLPLFDRIFTRIGASDDLLKGQSTFMTEMLEANQALQYGTENSLILFDEIGRGTATFDGMAIAQAMLEYINNSIHAKTLFSTHYHELTELADSQPGIENIHVDVSEKKGDIRFLYRMVPGRADKSYGINVARLAHLPAFVLSRAQKLLDGFEQNGSQTSYQPNLFVMEEPDPQKNYVMDQLEQLDVDSLSPREALECLYELKQHMKGR